MAPLWAGFAFDYLGHAVPYLTGAALAAGSIVFGLGIEAQLPRRNEVVRGK